MRKSLLIDLDGVLRVGLKPAEGLQKFFDFLAESKVRACVLSNSTLSSANDVKSYFEGRAINCHLPIITSVDGTLNYLRQNYQCAAVFCDEKIKPMFEEFASDGQPEAVVIGDMGKKWTFEILNDIFKMVKNGADLLAMQMNKFWSTPVDGLLLDAGAFVVAIEFATGKKAKLIGKPSPLYFKNALDLIGESDIKNFIMLGDDLDTDIKGANEIGAQSILIYTGKTAFPLPADFQIKPTYEVKNLLEVIELLKSFS